MKKFNDKAKEGDYAPFKLTLGKMLRAFDEMSENEYNLVGQVQVETLLIAQAYQDGTKSEREKIINRFGGHGDKAGKLDLDASMFNPVFNKDTVVSELNNFLQSLDIEKIDEKRSNAVEAVHSEKGVSNDAAAAGAIVKAFCLEGDRKTKDAIIHASLIMQMGLRSLERIDAMTEGEYDREAAQALQKLSSQLNYRFDHRALVKSNEMLDTICSIEKNVSSDILFALEDNQSKPYEQRLSDHEVKKTVIREAQVFHESAVRQFGIRLIDNMKTAADLYNQAGKAELAKRAQDAHYFYYEKYTPKFGLPHVMNVPKDNFDI